MQQTLKLIIENRALMEQLGLCNALLEQIYKHLLLGNTEVAKSLIEYSLKKENEDDR